MDYISIPHYRGLKEKYNEELHGDGIFFTTDTHEIIANSATYGETIADWSIADGVLTLTMTSGKTLKITFDEATESTKGLLSAADKKKLNTLEDNLNKKVDKVTGKSLVDDTEITKLSALPNITDLDNSIADAKKAGTDAQANLNTHTSNTNNPHNVTKAQVGLDKVDNTADIDKVVASASQLTTAIKLWGLDFDGTTDIDGAVTINDTAIVTGTDYPLVDLGLPSGTLWMDRNVGASSPEDAGLYFAWGETQGYTADEVGEIKQFSWDDYEHNYESDKYYGWDNKLLETTDDAVSQNVHKYSMPTGKQLRELVDETTSTWTTQNGVNGRLFTSKTNGNSIFVPAAGYGNNGSMSNVGSMGLLWSVEPQLHICDYSYMLKFNSNTSIVTSSNRSDGYSVRGVSPSKTITLPSKTGTLALDSVATNSSDGLMSATDKSTLDTMYSKLYGDECVTIGEGASSYGQNAVAIGLNANAENEESIAIGEGATATDSYGIAIGAGSNTEGYRGIAIGYNNNANYSDAIAIGTDSNAEGTNSIAIGIGATSKDSNSIVIGNSAADDGASYSVIIGSENTKVKKNSTVVGSKNTVTAENAVIVGIENNNTGTNDSIAIGRGVSTNNSISIGYGGASSTSGSLTIGNSSSSVSNGISLGNGNNCNNNQAILIGVGTSASGSGGIGIGTDTKAGANSIAIGNSSNATGIYGISLGHASYNSGSNSIAIGSGNFKGDNSIGINAASLLLDLYGPNCIGLCTRGGNLVRNNTNLGTSSAISIGDGVRTIVSRDPNIAISIGSAIWNQENISIGNNINPSAYTSAYTSINIGYNIKSVRENSIVIGKDITASTTTTSIVIGKNKQFDTSCFTIGDITSTDAKNLIDIKTSTKGMYIRGLGNYDGTNLDDADVESLQEVINSQLDWATID